jgi:CubicO group peptidase (beta-lactamase class C family)
MTMQKFFLIISSICLLFFVSLFLFISIQFSPTYAIRLLTLHVADVADYKHFENRVIEPAQSTDSFEYQLDEAYVESLFENRLSHSGFDTFDGWIEASQTTSIIVIKNNKVLYEKYFNGFSRNSYFHSQSIAKSFISFLIGAAIDDGYIKSVSQPITHFISSLRQRDQRFSKITIKDLLEMRSGLKYTLDYFPGTHIHSPWHDEALGYYHENVRELLLNYVDVESEPGQTFEYNNFNTSYLGLIVENSTGKTVSEYLEESLWSQIMEYDALFSIDSKESGFEYMPSRLIARAIDYARFGLLYLNQGEWLGNQIISTKWVKDSTSENPTFLKDSHPTWFNSDSCERTFYSYQWWGHTNCDGPSQYFASGNLGQNIYVAPDLDLVIVHTGASPDFYGDFDLWHVTENLRADAK